MRSWVKPAVSGLAAALIAIATVLTTANGISALGWITVTLAFMSGAGLISAVQAHQEVQTVRREIRDNTRFERLRGQPRK